MVSFGHAIIVADGPSVSSSCAVRSPLSPSIRFGFTPYVAKEKADADVPRAKIP